MACLVLNLHPIDGTPIESVNHPEARTAKVELQNILGSAHSFEQFSGPAWQKVKARINLAMQPKKKP
jgi:hypothetical protein